MDSGPVSFPAVDNTVSFSIVDCTDTAHMLYFMEVGALFIGTLCVHSMTNQTLRRSLRTNRLLESVACMFSENTLCHGLLSIHARADSGGRLHANVPVLHGTLSRVTPDSTRCGTDNKPD